MSEDDIMANALSNPDDPPLTESDLARLKPPPKSRALRIRQRLTQEEFAALLHSARHSSAAGSSGGASFETAPRGASSG
jgi:DNA-binding transcriptional regulator YiaG